MAGRGFVVTESTWCESMILNNLKPQNSRTVTDDTAQSVHDIYLGTAVRCSLQQTRINFVS